MKKYMKMYLAAAALLSVMPGCSQIEQGTNESEQEFMTLTLVADSQASNQDKSLENLCCPDTRTEMTPEGNITWSSRENSSFYTDGTYLHYSNVSQKKEGDKIIFTLQNVPAGTSVIDGFFGAKYHRYSEIKDNDGKTRYMGILINPEQNITSTTFDKNCDVLVMDTKSIVGSENQGTLTGITYNRLSAITKLKFKGFGKCAPEEVLKIEFEAQEPIAGSFSYDYAGKRFMDAEGNVLTDNPFTAIANNTVTLQYTDGTSISEGMGAWMVTLPMEFKAGEQVTVTIRTKTKNITKTFVVPQTTLKSTQLNELELDMSDAVITNLGFTESVLDLTKSPIPDNELSHGKNYFSPATRYKYDDTKNPNIVLIMGEGTYFYNNGTRSNFNLNKNQFMTIQGRKIKSIEFNWDSYNSFPALDVSSGTYTAEAVGGGSWKAPEGGVNEVTFKCCTQWVRMRRIIVRYDTEDSTTQFTPALIDLLPMDMNFTATDAQPMLMPIQVVNNVDKLPLEMMPMQYFKATIKKAGMAMQLEGDGYYEISIQPIGDNNGAADIVEDFTLKLGKIQLTRKVTQSSKKNQQNGLTIKPVTPGIEW